MPQGATKSKPKAKPTKLSTAHSASQKQKANTPRNRVIKPKHNSALARAQNMTKKGSGKLAGMLENKLAEKAGHTELIAKEAANKRKQGLEKKEKRAAGGKH